MNWPRYVKPAGIGPDPPPPAAISRPTLSATASLTCLPDPFGPMREKRNGGVASAAVAVTPATRAAASPSRPPMLSLSSPSPITK